MKNRSEISQFDIIRQLRFPMIVLVTYAHSYGGVAEGYNLLSSDWNTYEFLKLLISQTIVKVAVPVFFMMSGYLFFSNVREWNLDVYIAKMLRRAKTLLFPYMIWNLMMVLKLRTFSWSFFWEPANMPLWFLRDLIIVSLLTPFIYIGINRLGIWLFVALFPLYITGVWAIQPDLNPYGICFFSLGAFMSIRKLDLVTTCLRYERISYFLSAILATAMLMFHDTSIFMWLMLAFRITGAVAVFCLASHFTKKGSSQVFDSTYFIYLAHYVFFLFFIDEAFFALFGASESSLCLHYILCPLIKVAIFVGVYYIYAIIRKFLLRL